MTTPSQTSADPGTSGVVHPHGRGGGPRAAIALLLVGGLGLALAVWFVLALLRAAPPPALDVGEEVNVLRVPLEIAPFALTDHRGEPFDSSRLADHWTFLFFGYTYCPDVCPVTLATLRDARKRMAERDGEASLADVQFVFVSVDPARDTPERLAEFVPYFHPDFVGATGTPEQLEPLTRSLGIYAARSKGEDGEREEGYLLDHTVSVMLVDPDAKLHAIFSDPHEPAEISEAFEKIRAAREA